MTVRCQWPGQRRIDVLASRLEKENQKATKQYRNDVNASITIN
jgi:hypothetical protein